MRKLEEHQIRACQNLKGNGSFLVIMDYMVDQLNDLNRDSLFINDTDILLKNRGEALRLQGFIDAVTKAQK